MCMHIYIYIYIYITNIIWYIYIYIIYIYIYIYIYSRLASVEGLSGNRPNQRWYGTDRADYDTKWRNLQRSHVYKYNNKNRMHTDANIQYIVAGVCAMCSTCPTTIITSTTMGQQPKAAGPLLWRQPKAASIMVVGQVEITQTPANRYQMFASLCILHWVHHSTKEI